MNGWSSFFTAEVGASAALTGLIFVGLSINLTKILAVPKLPSRAFEALLLLVSVLVVSSLMLVPNQSHVAAGIEVLTIGGLTWLATVLIAIGAWRFASAKYKEKLPLHVFLSQIAVLPYFVAGSYLLRGEELGLNWLVPATLLSIVKANIDAWVLLVEINR